MEMSSPLAAMHPPPLPQWGFRPSFSKKNSLFRPHAHTIGAKDVDFNFRDMSMKKPTPDYFSLQPMRGSSPTASLAADMSSNLHVDQSPQLATPRRSLFTSNIFQKIDNRAEGATTPPVRWEGCTTPPIPSSSPCFAPDSMDISPLPHKAPFSLVTERSLPSPSPDTTTATDDDMLSPCELPAPPQFSFPAPEIEVPRPVSATEYVSATSATPAIPTPLWKLTAARRRKSILLRPTFPRTTHSTNSIFKSREPNPPFKFGAGVDSFSTASIPSLDECFTASPPQDRRPCSNPLLGSSKPKPFSLATNGSRANGSPLSASIRKTAGVPSRRPSKVRRSLSMFEHPADVMNAKQDKDSYTPSGLQSVMDIDDSPALKLPCITLENEPDSLPRITRETLIEVLDGRYSHLYDDTMVIDCRFEYEYNGGHIEKAYNYCEKEKLADRLFGAEMPFNTNKTLLILHCEYSAHRAPLMAKFVRHEDRKINCHRYPQLSYPEVYILDGGYSSFYESNRHRCEPQSYLRMDAEEHQDSCERGMNRLRQRSKLNRAQTFAFGQQSCQMEDSPTGIGRSRSGGVLTLGDDTLMVGRIGGSRRMASY